jgi:hypothetical protein
MSQINFSPLQHTLPHLYISAYEFRIVQSSAASHQLTACSAGPLFSISLRQIENEFLSMHFKLLGTGKSHSRLNSVNGSSLKHWNAFIVKKKLLHGEGCREVSYPHTCYISHPSPSSFNEPILGWCNNTE